MMMTKMVLVVGMVMLSAFAGGCSTEPSMGASPLTRAVVANVTSPAAPPAKAAPVVVNGKALDDKTKAQAAAFFGQAPAPGEWWYDAKSGLFGGIGHGTQGVLKAGFAVAPIARNASHGDTNVVVNGREITKTERDYLISIFNGNAQNPGQYAGSYDLDATGNLSKDGTLIGNVVRAAQARQAKANETWHAKNGSMGGSAPGCNWVYIPNSTTGSSTSVISGCD